MKKNSLLIRWYVLPMVMFIFGILSFILLLWTKDIRQQQLYNSLSIDMIVNMQLEVSLLHSLLEEYIRNDINTVEKEILTRLSNAKKYLNILLDGGTHPERITVRPLTMKKAQKQGASLLPLLNHLETLTKHQIHNRAILEQDVSIKNMITQRVHRDIHIILKAAKELEGILKQNYIHKENIYSYLFHIILGTWTIVFLVITLAFIRYEYHRRRITRDMQRSEERLHLALEGSELGLWDWNIQTGYVHFNTKWAQILGYALFEIEPHIKSREKLIHPDDRAEVMEILNEHLQGHTPLYETEHRMLTKSGQWRWIHDKGKVFERDEKGNPLRAAGTHRDVTEQKESEEALRQSEERQRLVIQNMPIMMNAFDKEGNIIVWNKECEKVTGYKADEIIGNQNAMELLYPYKDYREQMMNQWQEMGNNYYNWEWNLTAKNGTVKTISWSNISGKFTIPGWASWGIGFDITERKKMEETLIVRAHQQKVVADLGQLALTKTNLISLFDETVTKIAQTLNVEYCKILELLPGGNSLILKAGVGWKPGLVRHAVVGAERNSQAGYTLLLKEPVIVKDLTTETRFSGSSLLIEHNVISGISVIIGEPNNPWGVLDAHTTEQRYFSEDDVYFIQAIANLLCAAIAHFHTEKELLKTQALFNSAIEQTPAGIIIATSPEFKIWVANPAAFEILCEQRQNLIGHSINECMNNTQFFHPDRIPYKAQDMPLHQAILYGKTWSGIEIIIQQPDDEQRYVLCNAAPIYNEKGDIIAGITVFTDITERKSLEEQLYQSQKMEAVGSLAGGIAHDFNNLLTVIIGYSELILMNRDLPDTLKKNVEEIKTASNCAASLIRQLLAFSRKQLLNPKVLNLNSIVKELEKILKRLIGENIELSLILIPDVGLIKVDPVQLEQVIMNIAINARDAMPQGGKLTIETANTYLDTIYIRTHTEVKAGHYVTLSLSDTGCGMNQETQKRIYEPFYTTKEVGKGSGLGLATVYGIVKQSSGYIWHYSEPEKGTIFKIYFPIIKEEVDKAKPDKSISQTLTGTETILVVEDEQAVRTLATIVLKDKGYTVLEASHADEAIALFTHHKANIALILTDIVMPGMSGRDLIIRLTKECSEIKALYMSGYPDNIIAHHGILDPQVPLIQKPLTPLKLLKMVRTVLDSPSSTD